MPDAESRALGFLEREVPKWSRENGCFSCHNNGDAARALFAAIELGYTIPGNALADTAIWLRSPEIWSENKGDPGFSDQRLADIQFAAALRSLRASQPASMAFEYRTAIRKAALRIAASQDADGSWRIEPQNPVGSPATYGTALATFMAWMSLRASEAGDLDIPRHKALEWLGGLKPVNVPAAAVIIMASIEQGTETTNPNLEGAIAYLRRAQAGNGGWGPYAGDPPEVFDTALALVALGRAEIQSGTQEMALRGRSFLRDSQRPDGSWPATTRPSGGASYAQEISTTGWATLALLEQGRVGSGASVRRRRVRRGKSN